MSSSDALREIAETTLSAIRVGLFHLNDTDYDLRTKTSEQLTEWYSPSLSLPPWTPTPFVTPTTDITIREISTLQAAQWLAVHPHNNITNQRKIGILNFASATKPGGGFINGAQAQEESIARSSTLYPTLLTRTAQEFYNLHRLEANNGYYSHSLIYSPRIVVFRDDYGGWIEPFQVDVLTSAAVNAGEVRKTLRGQMLRRVIEADIESQMGERMSRILFLFEKKGVKNLVLGSFGTGVFRNDVDVVARLWADLLSVPGARFRNSFDRIVFAIIGKKTFVDFENAYNARKYQNQTVHVIRV